MSEGQTGITKLRVDLRNFENAPKKSVSFSQENIPYQVKNTVV